jgi:hypothetical protein
VRSVGKRLVWWAGRVFRLCNLLRTRLCGTIAIARQLRETTCLGEKFLVPLHPKAPNAPTSNETEYVASAYLGSSMYLRSSTSLLVVSGGRVLATQHFVGHLNSTFVSWLACDEP